jgi:hypothetical protein
VEIRELLDSPVVAAFAGLVATAPLWLFIWWMNRRLTRRWKLQDQRWELQDQLRDMEQAIREEAMSDEVREWWRRHRERQAAIKREARRRLGLPDEEPPAC